PSAWTTRPWSSVIRRSSQTQPQTVQATSSTRCTKASPSRRTPRPLPRPGKDDCTPPAWSLLWGPTLQLTVPEPAVRRSCPADSPEGQEVPVRKLASVQTVNAVEPIANADAIEKVRVLGWWVVVKKGEHRPGDKVVYCEIDSLLPERP